MIIYAGVDGTSSEDDASYQVTFQNSFVNQLYKKQIVPFSDTFYHRGPFTAGTDTASFARMAFNWVVGKWNSGGARAVFLGGYSRGAAGMIEVASWLKPLGIPVECLILFDAVDRSVPGIGGGVGGCFFNTKIADNVKQVIHPMRDMWTTLSRISFGRCGQQAESANTQYAKEYFLATHGGVGGTPWQTAVNPYTNEPRDTIWEFGELNPTTVTPIMDKNGAAMVAAWTFPKVINAFQQCKARLSAPSGPGSSYLPARMAYQRRG
jgi:hypothetical protein